MFFKKTALYTTFLIGLTTASPLQAADFKEEYQAYKTALAAKEFDLALQHLEAAYPLAEKIYGKTSRDYANLGFNLANAIMRGRWPSQKDYAIHSERAFALYQTGIAIYQQLPDTQPADIIVLTLNSIEVAATSPIKVELLDKALDLATAQNNPELLASTQLQAFEIVSRTDIYQEKHNRMLSAAFDYFKANAKTHPNQYLQATYAMAQMKYANKKLESAAEYFTDVIAQTKTLDYSHPMALASHARMVNIYERQGASEQATPHCVAIGSMTPWNSEQDPVPLFRQEPKYPLNAAKRGVSGFAKLKFTITPEGSVNNIEVLETKGSEAFGTNALDALAKWRYAPKFENGKAVAFESQVLLEYNITSR